MGIDLDGTARSAAARIDVEFQVVGQAPRPGAVRELGLPGVGRMRAGLEAGEVGVEGAFSRALPTRVGDDDGRVDADYALTLGICPYGGADAGVIGGRRSRHEPAAVVHDSHPGGFALTPGEVQTDEVHGSTVPHGR